MIGRLQKQKAASIMEYMALIMFFTAALLIFQFYILRALSGNWKKVGDSFGYGKQYDPRDYGNKGDGHGSLNCFWEKDHCQPNTGPGPALPDTCVPGAGPEDPPICTPTPRGACVPINLWVSQKCFDQNCNCYPTNPNWDTQCLQCIMNCSELQPQFADCAGP